MELDVPLADRVNVPDHIVDHLFPYQVPHLRALGQSLDRNRATLDASDTGTGKTRTGNALGAWKQMPVFAICPKAVVEDWFTVAPDYGTEIIGVANYEAAKNGKYYPTLEHFRRDERVDCPYLDVVRGPLDTPYDWQFPRPTLIIFDEAHRGKNHCTENSAMMMSILPILGPNKLLILSATITDKIEHFRVCAALLGISQYDRHAWNAWLRLIKQTYPGKSVAEIINIVLFPRFGARMRIYDIKQHELEFVRGLFKNNDVRAHVEEMSPEIEAQVAQAYGEIDLALTALRRKQQVDQSELHPLTIILRARQRIEMLKVPIFVLEAMQYIMNGHNVVIFVNFNETTEHLFAGLSEFVWIERQSHVTFINGKQSSAENTRNKREFQDGKSCLMICNIFSGGVGLSLHGERRVSLISPTWSSIIFKQALGRIYRAGGGDVIQRIIYCRGRTAPAGNVNANDTTFADGEERIGVEELIARNVNKKLETLEWLNNGDDIELMQI